MTAAIFQKQNRTYLILIVAAALALYLPFFFHFHTLRGQQMSRDMSPEAILPVYGSDSFGYARIADTMLAHHSFSYENKAPFLPDTFRTPGYPFLLALWKGIFGPYTFFPLLQIGMTIVTALLLFLIAEKMAGQKVAAVAAFFYLFDPNTIFHSLVLLSDILYVFLLLLSVYLLFFRIWKNIYLQNLCVGIVLGYATLTRPISVYLLFILLPFFIFSIRKTSSLKKIFLCIAVFFLAYGAFVLPWVIRNHSVTGVYGLSSVKDFNFFHYYVPEYLSYKNHTTPDQERMNLQKELGSVSPRDIASLKHAPLLHSIWTRHLLEDPFGYARFHLVKTIPFFLSSGVKTFEISYNDIVLAPVFSLYSANMTNLLLHGQIGDFLRALKASLFVTSEQFLLLITLFFALCTLLFRKDRFFSLLFLAIIFYFALLTGSVAYSRFRLPAAPFLSLLACAGFSMSIEWAVSVWRTRFANASRK